MLFPSEKNWKQHFFFDKTNLLLDNYSDFNLFTNFAAAKIKNRWIG